MLLIQLRGQNKQRSVRAIIDTGSQRSYILKQTAIEIEHIPVKKVKLILWIDVTITDLNKA